MGLFSALLSAGMTGESGAQVGNNRGVSQEQAGGLVRENVGASRECTGGESGTARVETNPLVCLCAV